MTARDGDGASLLEEPTDAWLVRVLAGALGEDSLVHRLFEDQLAGAGFPEAASIVWRCDRSRTGPNQASFVIYGSAYWWRSIKGTEVFEAVGFPDAEKTPNDD